MGTNKTYEKYKYSDITDVILRSYFKIYNRFGINFKKEIYENSLLVELQKSGLNTKQNKIYGINYEGEEVGEFTVNIEVNEKVQILVIVQESISLKDEQNLYIQLRETKKEVGIILNFGNESPEYKRKEII